MLLLISIELKVADSPLKKRLSMHQMCVNVVDVLQKCVCTHGGRSDLYLRATFGAYKPSHRAAFDKSVLNLKAFNDREAVARFSHKTMVVFCGESIFSPRHFGISDTFGVSVLRSVD